MASLPPAFQRRLRSLLGAEAETLFTALAAPPTVGLRVNTLKIEPADFSLQKGWPLEALPWCPTGFTMAAADAAVLRPGLDPWHDAGLYYLQDPSAMAVAEALAPKPGHAVIDLAAAPGGKTTHLASLMQGRGVLVANDPHPSRLGKLSRNLERWGAVNTVIVQESVARLADRWGARFDRVLLDAPCSGEGMFRKSAAALESWSEATVEACSLRQASLLADAARLVRPGGRLGYSTCTFAPEENEQVIAAFLAGHPVFRLVDAGLPGTSPGQPAWVQQVGAEQHHLERAARLWPQLAPGEGHFVAIMERSPDPGGSSSPAGPETSQPLPTRAKVLWQALVAETFERDPGDGAIMTLFRDRLLALPTGIPALQGLRVRRRGLWLGTLKKDRIEPAHALALALPAAVFRQRLELEPDDPRLAAYLHGHPLNEDGRNGWLAVTVGGFPIGWGRRARGIVKNAYPKGLRRP